MKTLNIYAALLLSIFTINSSFAQKINIPDTKENIKVWGNCVTCKKNIESVSLSAGARTASWNTTSKILTVTYEAAKTTSGKIQREIAASGYDTQDFKGDNNAYNKLASCCRYERSKGAMMSGMLISKMDCQKMADRKYKLCSKNDKCTGKDCKSMDDCKSIGCCKS